MMGGCWCGSTYFLNGPALIHPPPLLGGRLILHTAGDGMHVLFRPATYLPSPDILRWLPSKFGARIGSSAHQGQL